MKRIRIPMLLLALMLIFAAPAAQAGPSVMMIAAPTGVTAAPLHTEGYGPSTCVVKIEWQPVEYAEDYCVFYGTGKLGMVLSCTSAGSPAYVSGLLPATKYNFIVQARGRNGRLGQPSAVVSATTAAGLPGPTAVKAVSVSDTQIDVTWSPVRNTPNLPDHYSIYGSSDPSGPFRFVATVNGAGFSDMSLQAGQVRYYRVRAAYGPNEGAYSAVVSACSRPAIVTMDAMTRLGPDRVRFSWLPAAGAKRYAIYRALPYTGVVQKIGETNGQVFVDTKLAPYTEYWYQIGAIGNAGEGERVMFGIQTLRGSPQNLSATQRSAGVALIWDSVPDASSYTLYRAISAAGPYYLLYRVLGTPGAVDSMVLSGKTYYYKVSATVGIEGPMSAAVSVKPSGVPSAPVGLKAKALSANSVSLSWKASTGAAGYIVYTAAAQNGSYVVCGEATSPSCVINGFLPGTTRYFKVLAYNVAGQSALSTPVVCATLATIPAVPAPPVAMATRPDEILIHWGGIPGATGYHLLLSESPNGPFQSLNAFTNTNVPIHPEPGTMIYIRLSVSNAYGESKPSAVVACLAPEVLIDPPTVNSITPRNSRTIVLDCVRQPGYTKYAVYCSEQSSSDITTYRQVTTGSNPATLGGLKPGTMYYIRVATLDNDNRAGQPSGDYMVATPALPAAPAVPTFRLYQAVQQGQNVELSFQLPNTSIYDLKEDPMFLFYTATSKVGLSKTGADIRDSSMIGSTTNLYTVSVPSGTTVWCGFRAAYGSVHSGMQVLRVAALAKPSEMEADAHGTAVSLQWDKVQGAARYNIYASYDPPAESSSWEQFKAMEGSIGRLFAKGSTTSLTAEISGMPNQKPVYYVVVPVNAAGIEGSQIAFSGVTLGY